MRSLSRRDLIRFGSLEEVMLALACVVEEGPARRRLSKYSFGFDTADDGVDLECCAKGGRLHKCFVFVEKTVRI